VPRRFFGRILVAGDRKTPGIARERPEVFSQVRATFVPFPDVTKSAPGTLPRLGSRVRIPSSALIKELIRALFGLLTRVRGRQRRFRSQRFARLPGGSSHRGLRAVLSWAKRSRLRCDPL
jgi:hypothetical protein